MIWFLVRPGIEGSKACRLGTEEPKPSQNRLVCDAVSEQFALPGAMRWPSSRCGSRRIQIGIGSGFVYAEACLLEIYVFPSDIKSIIEYVTPS
jgi:hypothetical protein